MLISAVGHAATLAANASLVTAQWQHRALGFPLYPPVLNMIRFPDSDPTGCWNSEPDPDRIGFRKNSTGSDMDIQTALITAVKCLIRVFSNVNRIGSNIWRVLPDEDRTGLHNENNGLDFDRKNIRSVQHQWTRSLLTYLKLSRWFG